MTIGNRIFLKRPTCSVDLLKEFEQLPAANIADTMNRIAVLGNGIKRISSPKKPIMAGFAITVKVRAGDNLMLHAALDMAGENDVIGRLQRRRPFAGINGRNHGGLCPLHEESRRYRAGWTYPRYRCAVGSRFSAVRHRLQPRRPV